MISQLETKKGELIFSFNYETLPMVPKGFFLFKEINIIGSF